MKDTWKEKMTGNNCPMDNPRPDLEDFKFPVKKFSTATLYLNINQAYRGYCILVYDNKHVTRIDQLTDREWTMLARDIHAAETAIYQSMRPEHVNIASIGMIVPHLHWHIIPRYIGDPRWGGPIWTTDLDEMELVKLSDNEYREIVDEIKIAIDSP